MYNYGLKLCADQDIVKDFIQDVFFKLFKSDNIQPTQTPRAYLLAALRNTIFNYYTTKKENVSIDELIFIMPATQDSVLESLFAKNDAELRQGKRLLAAISNLSAQQKQILYLHYIKNLSHKEIAEILDINVQSSMNSISRTLIKLRFLLNDSSDFLSLLLLFHISL